MTQRPQGTNKPGKPTESREDSSIDPQQLLALSLFILLLAFFIVMTAISSVNETRSRPVIESLERTFASKPRGDDEYPSPQPGPEFGTGQGHAFDQLENLFSAQLPTFQAKRMDGDSTMFVQVREEEFFEAVRPRPDAVGGGPSHFVSNLIKIIDPAQSKKKYSLSLLVNLPESPQNVAQESPDQKRQIVRRAGQYGTILTQNNLPSELLSVGLQQGEAGFVVMLFNEMDDKQRRPEDSIKGVAPTVREKVREKFENQTQPPPPPPQIIPPDSEAP